MDASMQESVLKALSWRYAVQVFDPTKTITEQELHTILEAGRLAPSAFGVEPWKFIVVENKDVRAKLHAVSYSQPKVIDAAHIVVIARRTDVRENISRELIDRASKTNNVDPSALGGLKNMVDGSIAAQSDAALDAWARAQVYIPLGIMIETAALLGVDGGPMEGFMPAEVDKVLGLAEKHLTATAMLALGHRGDDSAAKRKKVRRAFDDVVEFVR